MAHTLTVIVPTFNEEDNIRECLESVQWADDIFVVDSFSTDRTLEIAREFTDHVVQHEYVNSATQKNWAIPQVESDWVMVVDADERVTPALRARIQGVLENGADVEGFQIRRTTTYFGRVIRHCGWHKDYLVRLWRNGKGRYEDLEVHADVLVDGKVGRIEEPLMHHTYRSMADYMERFDRYTTWSANDLYNRGKSASWSDLTLRPLWRFFRMYILRRGFLDGKHGFVLCAFAASSVFAKYAKLWERRLREAAGGEHARPADPN
jgi:glycosyltransferase involved in cell wall biosynthesis